jgi:hypothetical protein
MYDSVEDCDEPNADPPNPPNPLVGSRPLLACDLNVFLLMFADSWGPVYWIVVGSRGGSGSLRRMKTLCVVLFVYVRRDSHKILFSRGEAKGSDSTTELLQS